MGEKAMAESLDLDVNGSAAVVYAEGFGAEEFKLLEVDESILQELLQDGLTIKGGENDEAVLCTSSTTYAIKYVSTSNTVLLIPPVQPTAPPAQPPETTDDGIVACMKPTCAAAGVVATASGLIELVETAPRVEKLKALLNQRPYSEDLDEEQMLEEDERGRWGLYSLADLVSQVQASRVQIESALASLHAVELDGFWRLVDTGFMQGLLEIILLSAVQHDWDLKCLPEPDVVETIRNDGYSPRIVQHCLACYGREIMQEQPEGVRRWTLEESKVCLHYAKQQLRASSKWKLEDFVEAWKNNVPSGFQPELEMLKGEVLVEKSGGGESWLRLFSVAELPSKPAERFAALFNEKTKWEWDDLEPYLRGMQAPGQSVEAMLLRYTRKSQASPNVPAIYTPR